MTLEELMTYRTEILALAKKYHAPNIRVFGSVARGEATERSDIDFLIDLSPEQTLFDLIRLSRSLKDLLGCEVEIVQSPGLHPLIRDKVLQEAIPL